MKASDEQIIAAILSNATNKSAAAACGLSEKQFYTRLAKPELKAKLSAARTRLLEGATSAIRARMGDAVETMGIIMCDASAPAQTRLNAADSIIRNSLKMGEMLDVLERVDRLERAVQEIDKEGRQ